MCGRRVGREIPRGFTLGSADWNAVSCRLCRTETSRRLWFSHELDLVIPVFNLQGQDEPQLRYCGCRRLL